LAGQLAGEALGGMSTDVYTDNAKKIENLEKVKDKLNSSSLKFLKTLKDENRAYDDNSSFAQRAVTMGEDLRRVGDNMVESTTKGAIEINHMSKTMMGFESGLESVGETAGKTAKEIADSIAASKKAAEEAEKNMAGTNPIDGKPGGGGAAAKREELTLTKETINLDRLRNDLAYQTYMTDLARNNIHLSSYDMEQLEIENAQIKYGFAQLSYEKAVETAALRGDSEEPAVVAKLIQLQIKARKDEENWYKKRNKYQDDFRKSMARSANSFMDTLTGGEALKKHSEV